MIKATYISKDAVPNTDITTGNFCHDFHKRKKETKLIACLKKFAKQQWNVHLARALLKNIAIHFHLNTTELETFLSFFIGSCHFLSTVIQNKLKQITVSVL